MRLLYSGCLLFLSATCSFSQSDPGHPLDTLANNRINGNSVSVNFRMLSGYARYDKRYYILSDYNDDYNNIEINHSMQNFISAAGYKDSSIISNYNLVKNSNFQFPGDVTCEKQVFYGAWRNKVTKSTNAGEIKSSVTEGTRALIGLGYSNLENDFLPFITVLMEEQHIVNYDNARTKAFGKGSRGIVTSIQILGALNSQSTEQNYGVCRDVHEMGREMLKTMSETWYAHFYPDEKTDFDDYIFLQSWTTNKSHHVTVSLIDPHDTKTTYELDWGRVIKKRNNQGYDNGRLYGNTFRIWQYDKKKQLTVPVDFRRTHFGKILDENILTREEYTRFNGTYDEEFFSDIRYLKDLGKYGGLSFSLGTYNPGQYYFLAGWQHETRKKKITRFLEHSSLLAVQGVIHEDTRKKQLLYPHIDWQFAGSIMGIPRIISKFQTSKFHLSDNLTFDAFLDQQFDIFLIGNSFFMNDSIDDNDLSGSGDGNLSFSNGINLSYSPGQRFSSSLTLQARSCLLPKEIRLFTPNVFTLIPSLRFITPAFDALATGIYRFSNAASLSADGIMEFTSLGAVIFSGSVSAGFSFAGDFRISSSLGMAEQVHGIDYFWYPSTKRWINFSLGHRHNSLSFSLLKYPESNISCNFSFRKTLH